MNTSSGEGEWLINNGYEIIGFLSLSISDFNVHADEVVNNSVDQDPDCQLLSLEDEFNLTSTSRTKEQNMLVIHEALTCSLQSLKQITVPGFLIRSDREGMWNCFPTVV